jgi:hypothetical protein
MTEQTSTAPITLVITQPLYNLTRFQKQDFDFHVTITIRHGRNVTKLL